MATRTVQSIARELHVTDYVDYRDYLGELYRRAKDVTSPYSYEAFAKDLGFSATNVLRLVILRKRLLSLKSAQTIVKALELRHEQRRYFLAMVKQLSTPSARLKEQHGRTMLQAKQDSMTTQREKGQLAMLADWYHWVILELLRLPEAKPDPTWLSKKLLLALPPERIRQSLTLLDSIGAIKLDPAAGTVTIEKENTTFVPSDASSAALAMTGFHQAMINNAKEAIAHVPDDLRDFNALTVSISADAFSEIREKAQQFCADVMEIESRDQKRDCVAQLNVNLFSLTRWVKE